ncbi:phosphoethanolamine transferase [Proteus mirabilis]|uniref:phosphoethanolamine transferase n=1 Tax=Proteus mirabilis TaxID=584 RepID=UPI0038068EBA|nr:phosphoethanolamine transferase [Proteus mirabilis]
MLLKKRYIFVIVGTLTYLLNVLIYNKDSSIPHLTSFAFLLFILFATKSKNKIINIIGFILSFLLFLECFYTVSFKEKISTSILDSIIETNKTEFLLMLSRYILTIILPSIIISIIFFKFIKKKITLNIKPQKIITIIISLYLFCFFSINSVFSTADKRWIADIKEDEKLFSIFIRDRFPMVLGNITYLVSSIYNNVKYSYTFDIEKFNSVIIKPQKIENKLIVLVIGESSLSSRYSAYGYPINTTPNIKKIFSHPDACIIKNAHSSAPITRNSVSMTLSFYTPESNKNLFENKSIIEMAKSNGYQTYWIGSQKLKGLHDSKYGFIAKKSNHIWLTDFKDDELPYLFEKALQANNENKFIIIHLWGSHYPYNNFDNEDEKALPNVEKYDLTVHHTDKIINLLYKKLKTSNEDYILLYTSDHGEIVNKGHGFYKGKEQFLVPFLYKSNNPKFDCDFIESFRNKDGWLSGLMNKYILSKIIGYQLDDQFIEKEKNHDRILNANEEVQAFSEIQ